MGAANSKVEEDRALQLCRERKKYVKQALDGRCSLADTHVFYVRSLNATGSALRKFVQPESHIDDDSLYTSTNATPEPPALTDMTTFSHFSASSPSVEVEAPDNAASPSPSTPVASRFRMDHMKFSGSSLKDVKKTILSPTTGTVVFSSTPLNTTPRSTDRPDSSPFDRPHTPSETSPWDYFRLFHPIDHQFSFQDGKRSSLNIGLGNADDIRRLREEEGIPNLEDDEDKAFSITHETDDESHDSENEFDEPSTATLIRRFENVNRMSDRGVSGPPLSAEIPPAVSVASETEFSNKEDGDGSPTMSSLRDGGSSPVVTPLANRNKEQEKEDQTQTEAIVEPKDFITSIIHIELLFLKASESGKEVPKMLEANNLQITPTIPARESVSLVSMYFKACFSCGQERRQVQEEPAQAAIKYLTMHNMASPSPSSSNALELSSKEKTEAMNANLFNNFCMASGSHASTLDRLYAWERKLYDEVKASEMIRSDYDYKCKLLRQLESKDVSSQKIDKIRADIKDLHSRIRVAIHRIDSISKKIEEVRDKELQPQLEELIEGLSRMWQGMSECHKLQYRIIDVAHNSTTKITMNSESRRQIATLLESELSLLSLSFTKWIGAQEFYLWAINNWLNKCVSLPQIPNKRKKRAQAPPLRNFGPPIYATCDVWLSKLSALPSKEVADAVKALASETRKFMPRQEKNQGKGAKRLPSTSWEPDNVSEAGQTPEDPNITFDRFRSRLVGFLGKLSEYSESSVDMYKELKEAIKQAKINYARLMSRSQP